MNSYAFVFAAFVIAVQGGSLRVVRQSGGWGAPPPPPPAPSAEIILEADGAAVGTGQASAIQDVLVVADGNPNGPAAILLEAGTNAIIAQDVDIDQVGLIDLPNQSSTSLNVVSVDNLALGNESADILAVGGDSVVIIIAGADTASGAGAIAANANSSNTQNLKRN